jgi:hypothetical protein
VEELAKTSLSEAQEKYKKALQEYEKTYARANPPPEPVTVRAILNPTCDKLRCFCTSYVTDYFLRMGVCMRSR